MESNPATLTPLFKVRILIPLPKEKEHSRSVLFSFCKLDKNFFDATKYAGEGNIGHIMMHVAMHKQELLK